MADAGCHRPDAKAGDTVRKRGSVAPRPITVVFAGACDHTEGIPLAPCVHDGEACRTHVSSVEPDRPTRAAHPRRKAPMKTTRRAAPRARLHEIDLPSHRVQRRVRSVCDRIRMQAEDMRRDRSALCPGIGVPPYVAARLGRARRLGMRTPGGTFTEPLPIETSFDRPIRVLYENGVEVRLIPGAALEIRTIYHVHPWILGVLPRRRRPWAVLRPESVEDPLDRTTWDWAPITDPELSNHERLALHARRRGASSDLGDALIVDATMAPKVELVSPETTIVLTRDRMRDTMVSGLPVTLGKKEARGGMAGIGRRRMLSPDLRAKAQLVDDCIAVLPAWRRIALDAATQMGALYHAAECAMVRHILRPIRRRMARAQR